MAMHRQEDHTGPNNDGDSLIDTNLEKNDMMHIGTINVASMHNVWEALTVRTASSAQQLWFIQKHYTNVATRARIAEYLK